MPTKSKKTTKPRQPKIRRPWEDGSGKTLPKDVLKEVSKSWSPQLWEEYLNTIEGSYREVEVDDFETLSMQHGAETALQEFLIGERAGDDPRSKFLLGKSLVKKALYKLTHRQQALIKLVYMRSLSLKKAADLEGLSSRCAGRTLRRALAKLKTHLKPKLEKRV
jgi:DNA-directed RNA polymerase specialized sigma24 family protein